MIVDEPEFPDDPDEIAPETPNAADPVSQRRIRDRAKREAAEKLAFWRSVFGSEVGRREMWWLLYEKMHAFRDRFVFTTNGSECPPATFAEAGIQRIGFDLYRLFQSYTLEGVMTMHRENDPALRPPPKPKRHVPKPDEPWPVDNV